MVAFGTSVSILVIVTEGVVNVLKVGRETGEVPTCEIGSGLV